MVLIVLMNLMILILSEDHHRIKSVKKLKSTKSVTGKGQKNLFRNLSRTTSSHGHRSRDPFRSALLDTSHGPKKGFQTKTAIEMGTIPALPEDTQISGADAVTDIKTLKPGTTKNVSTATPSTATIATAAAEAVLNGHRPDPSGESEAVLAEQAVLADLAESRHSVSRSGTEVHRFIVINRQGSTMMMEEGPETGHEDDPFIMEQEPEDFTWRRRIWYITRCFVVVYLYLSTSVGFCFMFNEDRWQSDEKLILIILNLTADIFMWINLGLEALYFHPDDYNVGRSSKRDIDVEMESRDVLQNEHKVLEKEVVDREVRDDDDSVDQEERRKGSCCGWLERQLKPRRVLSLTHYRLSHRFSFDLVINIPVDWILILSTLDWPLWVTVRLIKLIHFWRFFEYFQAAFWDIIPERGIMRSAFVARLARFWVIGMAWIHLWSCVWFYLGSTLHIDEGDHYYDDEKYANSYISLCLFVSIFKAVRCAMM